MFYETNYPTCKPDETLTETASNKWACLTQAQWEAQEIEQSKRDKTSNVIEPQPEDAWTNYAIYGGLALIGLLLFMGGRRR